MTASQVWIGMWIKILKIFWPAVIFGIVGLTYLWIDEKIIKKACRSDNSKQANSKKHYSNYITYREEL